MIDIASIHRYIYKGSYNQIMKITCDPNTAYNIKKENAVLELHFI